MRKERFVISDRSWEAIEPLVPGTARDRGVTAKNTRLFLEAVLWRVRVGRHFAWSLITAYHAMSVAANQFVSNSVSKTPTDLAFTSTVHGVTERSAR